MSWLDKLKQRKQKLSEQFQRGKVVTEQMKAERLRKRHHKIQKMKPGSAKTISEGLANRSSPLDVMHKEWDRRKQIRDEKHKK